MTIRAPLVLISGTVSELPSGDSVSGAAAASATFTDVNVATYTFVAGASYRLRARVTAGSLPASPGLGGGPITLCDGTGAAVASPHTINPNGSDTITIAGSAYTALSLNNQRNVFVLIPISGGWELKVN
jgi:hypothetical protein